MALVARRRIAQRKLIVGGKMAARLILCAVQAACAKHRRRREQRRDRLLQDLIWPFVQQDPLQPRQTAAAPERVKNVGLHSYALLY
jgi:hypothetical protein